MINFLYIFIVASGSVVGMKQIYDSTQLEGAWNCLGAIVHGDRWDSVIGGITGDIVKSTVPRQYCSVGSCHRTIFFQT